jgi:hypothetical protein
MKMYSALKYNTARLRHFRPDVSAAKTNCLSMFRETVIIARIMNASTLCAQNAVSEC